MCPARGANVQFNSDCLAGIVRVVSRFVASPSASPSVSPSPTSSVAASPSFTPTRTVSPSPSPSSPCGVFVGNTYGQLPGNFNPGPYDGNTIRVLGGCAIDYVSIQPGGTVGTQGGADRITQVCGGNQFVAFGYALAGLGNPGCINGRTSTYNGGWTCASGNAGWTGLVSIGPFACLDGTVDPQMYTANGCTADWSITDYTYTLPARLCAANA